MSTGPVIRWIVAGAMAGVNVGVVGAQGGGGAPGAPTPPPEVTVAQAVLQAGQVDSAIRTLEGFFAKNPNTAAGRLLLGNAYARKGELDKAVAAYEKVTVPRPMRLQAMFLSAGIQARRGKSDEAFKLLGDLKATGAYDMDLVETTADFETLRRDPRYASVKFKPVPNLKLTPRES